VGTNRGERKERGAEVAKGVGFGEVVSSSQPGEGLCPFPEIFRFLSSKWQVLVHSGS